MNTGYGDRRWIQLPQDRVQLRSLTLTALELRVSLIYLSLDQLMAAENLCWSWDLLNIAT